MKPQNAEQSKLWNGTAGQAWVEGQQLLDGMFQPFERLLADEARKGGARQVLDVGCGAGATTLAIARALGPDAQCTGIDISDPLLTAARARAARENIAARFLCEDAQTAELSEGHFDLLVSRFGVMFFEDAVQAFGNLRRASTPGARLRFITFRSAAENPFMTAAERAAAPYAPDLPPRKPGAPGQFALAERGRNETLLRDSGWSEVESRPIDVECRFPAAALDDYMTRFGPLGLYLAQSDAATRERLVTAVRAAFTPYLKGDEVRFTAACWMLCASNR